MAVTVRLPTIMRSNAGGQSEISAEGATIGEVIDDVVGRFPRLDDDQFADLVSRLRPPVES